MNVVDAARALIHAAESGLSGVMVVADDLPCTWNEFFEAVRISAGEPGSVRL